MTLDVKKKFRVVFEGIKGAGPSSGGLSIDDINLSETECPHHQWRIPNFAQLLAATPPGKKVYSPRFLSREGYSFQVGVYLNGTSSNPGKMAIYFYLVSGNQDHTLQWPCPWKQATMMLMDQNADIRRQMNNQRSVTTDPNRYDTDGESPSSSSLYCRERSEGQVMNMFTQHLSISWVPFLHFINKTGLCH